VQATIGARNLEVPKVKERSPRTTLSTWAAIPGQRILYILLSSLPCLASLLSFTVSTAQFTTRKGQEEDRAHSSQDFHFGTGGQTRVTAPRRGKETAVSTYDRDSASFERGHLPETDTEQYRISQAWATRESARAMCPLSLVFLSSTSPSSRSVLAHPPWLIGRRSKRLIYRIARRAKLCPHTRKLIYRGMP